MSARYCVTEEDDGTVTLELQDDTSEFSSAVVMVNLTPNEMDRLAFELTSAARRQRTQA